jgi:phosphoglycolate phosphatase-like HAD superfamily hydrolase
MDLCRERAAALANFAEFSNVTYVGDGIWDVYAARDLGWQFIGVGTGPRAERLRSEGASHVVSDFRDEESVLELLGIDYR